MSESRANLHSSLAHALSRPPSGQGQRFREGSKEGNVDLGPLTQLFEVVLENPGVKTNVSSLSVFVD